jgi:hypothetical protein
MAWMAARARASHVCGVVLVSWQLATGNSCLLLISSELLRSSATALCFSPRSPTRADPPGVSASVLECVDEVEFRRMEAIMEKATTAHRPLSMRFFLLPPALPAFLGALADFLEGVLTILLMGLPCGGTPASLSHTCCTI